MQHHNNYKADVRATSTKASAGGNHCGAGHDDSCDGDDSSGCGTYYRSGEKAATLATAPSKSNRAWWNELLTSLEGDVQFQASLQGCIEQGESAYRK